MRRRRGAGVVRAALALAAVAGSAAPAGAQLFSRSIELFGTAGGVVGVAPVETSLGSRAGLHGGFRFDGGIQGDRVGVGIGARLWELAPSSTIGGHGLDAFLLGELRVGSGLRTTVRATAGAGFDDIDGGRGPEIEGTGASGFGWSVGIGHEIHLTAANLILLSADLVMPNVNADVPGRRLPIVELGFAFRTRRRVAIGPVR